MDFHVWRSTRRMERAPSFRESYWYVYIDFSFYIYPAISLLWSYQRQPIFLCSLQFKIRCLTLTYRQVWVRASYSMWLAAWDILWGWQKAIFLQSRYRYSRYASTIDDAISPFGPSTSVWFAQSYLVPTQPFHYIAELEQLFPEFKSPQITHGWHRRWSWTGGRKFHNRWTVGKILVD